MKIASEFIWSLYESSMASFIHSDSSHSKLSALHCSVHHLQCIRDLRRLDNHHRLLLEDYQGLGQSDHLFNYTLELKLRPLLFQILYLHLHSSILQVNLLYTKII